MAISTIKKPLTSKKALDPQGEYTFPLVEGSIILLAFGHPYSRACAGLYLIVGGYTTTENENIIPILATDKVTITKTSGCTCKVVAKAAIFMTVVRGGVNARLLRDLLSGGQHDEYDKKRSAYGFQRHFNWKYWKLNNTISPSKWYSVFNSSVRFSFSRICFRCNNNSNRTADKRPYYSDIRLKRRLQLHVTQSSMVENTSCNQIQLNTISAKEVAA